MDACKLPHLNYDRLDSCSQQYITACSQQYITACSQQYITACSQQYITACSQQYITACSQQYITACSQQYITAWHTHVSPPPPHTQCFICFLLRCLPNSHLITHTLHTHLSGRSLALSGSTTPPMVTSAVSSTLINTRSASGCISGMSSAIADERGKVPGRRRERGGQGGGAVGGRSE